MRYREKNRKWNYQTCPTSDTVIDNLKPNTVYEFGVQPNSKDGTGLWSKPVIHNISTGGIEGMFDVSFSRDIAPLTQTKTAMAAMLVMCAHKHETRCLVQNKRGNCHSLIVVKYLNLLFNHCSH